MKKVFIGILSFIAALCLFILPACTTDTGSSNDDENGQPTDNYTDEKNANLEFELNDDGTGYIVSGLKSNAADSFDIPATYNKLPVTGIKDWLFHNCTKIKSISVPDSFKELNEWAFNGCTNLVSVTLGKGITYIGDNAFGGCTSLVSVNIPDGVTKIGNMAFRFCSSLKSIIIPQSVTEIGYMAFYECTSLTDLTLKKGLVTIEQDAFYKCYALKEVVIPDTVETISHSAFGQCKFIINLTIPESVNFIGTGAFSECESLANITLPEKATNIGMNAFKNTAAYNDSKNWESGVFYIGNHMLECNSTLTGNCKIKDGTLTIAMGAFAFCSSLRSVTIPKSVLFIGNDALNCSNLKSIEFKGSEEQWGHIVDDNSRIGLKDDCVFSFANE